MIGCRGARANTRSFSRLRSRLRAGLRLGEELQRLLALLATILAVDVFVTAETDNSSSLSSLQSCVRAVAPKSRQAALPLAIFDSSFVHFPLTVHVSPGGETASAGRRRRESCAASAICALSSSS